MDVEMFTLQPEIRMQYFLNYIIQIYSGITSSRVLNGELIYTKIPEEQVIVITGKVIKKYSQNTNMLWKRQS